MQEIGSAACVHEEGIIHLMLARVELHARKHTHACVYVRLCVCVRVFIYMKNVYILCAVRIRRWQCCIDRTSLMCVRAPV